MPHDHDELPEGFDDPIIPDGALTRADRMAMHQLRLDAERAYLIRIGHAVKILETFPNGVSDNLPFECRESIEECLVAAAAFARTVFHVPKPVDREGDEWKLG